MNKNRTTHAASFFVGIALMLANPGFSRAASCDGGRPVGAESAPPKIEARAAVFTVISAADTDDGRCDNTVCTLRDAIKAANASPGADTIQFRIGSGAAAIRPASPLPAITDPVTLDATTQPGFSGAPLIVLDGANAVSTGLTVASSNSVISGLVVCQFTGDGIQISGSGNQIRGSYIGTDPSGSVAKPNGQRGVFIGGGTSNTIGGENPGDGNVISGNQAEGVRISGGSGNLVRGNRIGTDASGLHAIANGASGVTIESAKDNQVGCTMASARNVISGNAAAGVTVTGSGSTGNLVGANFIGTDAAGSANLGNSGDGVLFASGASGNTVGGPAAESPNRIAFNHGNGISAQPGAGSGNTFRSNSIYANKGLPIDLNADGPTRNDTGDSDSGPNGLQNYPILLSLSSAGGNTFVTGTLNSAPGGTYTIEFFAGGALGSVSIGTTAVTTDAGGNAVFSTTLPLTLLATDTVTATATDSAGSTSELSAGIEDSMGVSTVTAPRVGTRRIPSRPVR